MEHALQISTWNSPLCGCGKPRKAWRPYCADCSRARRPGWNALTPEAKRRSKARSYLNTYLRRGKITKGPCADCGGSEVEAHHADYSKPLEVTWLCRECHMKRHGVNVLRCAKASKADIGKPAELYEFYRLLAARGESTNTLAKKIGQSGGAVRRVLVGLRRRGPIWSKLLGLLTDQERTLLERAALSPWIQAHSSRRPRWTPEKQTALRGE